MNLCNNHPTPAKTNFSEQSMAWCLSVSTEVNINKTVEGRKSTQQNKNSC